MGKLSKSFIIFFFIFFRIYTKKHMYFWERSFFPPSYNIVCTQAPVYRKIRYYLLKPRLKQWPRKCSFFPNNPKISILQPKGKNNFSFYRDLNLKSVFKIAEKNFYPRAWKNVKKSLYYDLGPSKEREKKYFRRHILI